MKCLIKSAHKNTTNQNTKQTTYPAPPDRLYAAGCVGSASPPYRRGFSPAPETETCSWFYCSPSSSARACVAEVVSVVAVASLGLVPAALSGRHLWPWWLGRLSKASQAIRVSPLLSCYLSTAPPCCPTSRHVTPSCMTMTSAAAALHIDAAKINALITLMWTKCKYLENKPRFFNLPPYSQSFILGGYPKFSQRKLGTRVQTCVCVVMLYLSV